MLIPLLYDDIYTIPGRDVYIFMTGCLMNYYMTGCVMNY